MTQKKDIRIYIFRTDDGKSPEERLRWAAMHYCRLRQQDFPDLYRMEIARTERGKPFFPNWPGLHFSVSHSGGYWVCAFAEQEIGVDVQEHTCRRGENKEEAAERFGRMARRFFHPAEALYVAQGNSYERFFEIWTARESYVKYTGKGIDVSFPNHCVLPENGGCWQAMGVWFQKIAWQTSYTLCVCTADRIACHVMEIGEEVREEI